MQAADISIERLAQVSEPREDKGSSSCGWATGIGLMVQSTCSGLEWLYYSRVPYIGSTLLLGMVKDIQPRCRAAARGSGDLASNSHVTKLLRLLYGWLKSSKCTGRQSSRLFEEGDSMMKKALVPKHAPEI